MDVKVIADPHGQCANHEQVSQSQVGHVHGGVGARLGMAKEHHHGNEVKSKASNKDQHIETYKEQFFPVLCLVQTPLPKSLRGDVGRHGVKSLHWTFVKESDRGN